MDQEKPQGQFSRFQAACRSAGLKLTHQRLEIYRELTVAKDHPSAEALYQRLIQKIPTLSLDTVYRTLATFTRHGLAHRVETVESQARFDAKHERHHHAICSRCRISVNLQRSCRLTLEELSRVPQAMAFQSYLSCFVYR